MNLSRIFRIVVGLGLIAYALYSGNAWFYLGVIPLVIGLMNWCPLEKMLGNCKEGSCDTSSGCCSPKSDSKLENKEVSNNTNFSSFSTQKSCCSDDKCC